MLRVLLHMWASIAGVQIFLYNGCRSDLSNIKECVVRSIQGHSIVFNFYKKYQTNTVVRFGRVRNKKVRYYVIEAIFSDGFKDNYKAHNEIKYYIDFKANWIFNPDVVLDVLLSKFVTYLEHSLQEQ